MTNIDFASLPDAEAARCATLEPPRGWRGRLTMQTDTPEALLEAVGITAEVGGTCPSGHRLFMGGEYIGPALGTPELDGILLVAGVAWLRANIKRRVDIYTAVHKTNGDGKSTTVADVALWLFEVCDTPGHALARAIREVGR